MTLVSSTGSDSDGGGAGGSPDVILSICAIDGHKLIFAIASAAGAGSAVHSFFDAGLFYSHKAAADDDDDAVKSISPGLRPLPSGAGGRGDLRCALYAYSRGGSPGAGCFWNPKESGECLGCSSEAASASNAMGSPTLVTPCTHSRESDFPPERSGAAAAVISFSEKSSRSLAALRASEWSHSFQDRDLGAREPLNNFSAGTPLTSLESAAPLFSTDALVALHLVRQEARSRSPDAKNATTPGVVDPDALAATTLSADVFFCFCCGCAALATFTLARGQLCGDGSAATAVWSSPRHAPPAEWSVRLSGCAWIPSAVSPKPAPCRSAGADRGGGSLLACADGVPLVSSLVRVLPLTAPLGGSVDVNHDGKGPSLEALVVWCSHTVASPSSVASSSTCSPPVLRYASFRSGSGNLAMGSTATSTWQLHAQATFDMSDLLLLAPRLSPPRKDFHDPVPSCTALPYASVRSLKWLPGTATFRQSSYPLLAVLYAAPIVHYRQIDGVSGSLAEPCLDSLAVCYLEEDAHHLNVGAAPAAVTPHRTPPVGTGRVLVGPWSVRALALAHPQFLFATALTGLCSPSFISSSVANRRSTTIPNASAPSAAQVFRAALHSSTAPATVVLGIFQRPVQEPYATSSLFRSVAAAVRRHRHRVRDTAEMPSTARDACRLREPPGLQRASRAQDDISAPRNSNVFAFVLYGSDGEVARCALDGYVDSAQTSWSSPLTTPRHRGGGPCTAGDFLRQGSEKERRPVARICVLLAERPSALSAAKTQSHSSVVILTIQAQWSRAPPIVATGLHSNEANSNGGCGAGDHWSFSVHLSHRLRLSAPPCGWSRLHSGRALTLLMTGRILCWRSSVASLDAASGEVSCLVCGYATAPDHSDKMEREVVPTPRTLLEGIFELRMSSSVFNEIDCGGDNAARVAQTMNATLGLATSGGAAFSGATASPSESSAALASPHPWALGSCVRVVPPSAFWASLRDLSVADTLTTAFDLMSHTPTLPLVAARLGAGVCDGMVPVAFAWVSGGVHHVDKGGPPRIASPRTPAATAPSSESSVLSRVAQLDVVALLRSGDVVGWRCARRFSVPGPTSPSLPSGDGAVLHLGSICWGPPDVISPPLMQLFLESLLNRGVGADAVHMEVVTVPTKGTSQRAAHEQAGVELASMGEGISSSVGAVTEAAVERTVLLVLAVASLVGVVDLSTGMVVVVRDLHRDLLNSQACGDAREHGSAAPSAGEKDATTLTASVLHLQRLPVVSPCGWMTARDAGEQGARSAVGTSWYFMWCGIEEVQRSHSPPSPLPAPTTSLTFVLRLSFLSWADAVAVHMGPVSGSTGAGAALPVSILDSESSPAPLIKLEVDAFWKGEASTLGSSTLVSCASGSPSYDFFRRCAPSLAVARVGWISCATAGVVPYSVGCASVRETTLDEETRLASDNAAEHLALLSVCDDVVLRSLWPAFTSHEIQLSMKSSEGPCYPPSGSVVPRHRRRPLRLLRWGCAAPRLSPSSSLLLHTQISASCVEEQLAGGEAAVAAGIGMPLHVVYRSLLGENCDANATFTPPKKVCEADVLCRLSCREVLYVSTLTLDASAEEGPPDEPGPERGVGRVSRAPSRAVPGTEAASSCLDPSRLQVLLCTMWLCNGEQSSSESDSTRTSSNALPNSDVDGTAATATAAMGVERKKGQAASYLLCGVPVVLPQTQPGGPASAGHIFPLFTWHWIPLYISPLSPVPDRRGGDGVALSETATAGGSGGVEGHHASLAVTRVFPLPSHEQFSAATLTQTHSSSVFEKTSLGTVASYAHFYCEGMPSSFSAAAAATPHGQPSCYCVSIRGGRLRHLLEQSVASASTEGFEKVYLYTSVDPDLVRVVGCVAPQPRACTTLSGSATDAGD